MIARLSEGSASVLAPAADRAAIRRGNLGLILRLLREHGARSRVTIAQDTRLSKATVSTLMAELTMRGLVRDSHVEREGAVGRPAQAVELDGSGICALGAEVNQVYLEVMAQDLQGRDLYRRRLAIDVPELTASETLDQLAQLLRLAVSGVRKDGIDVVGACVAIPGVVDADAGKSVLAPGLGWSDVDVTAQLRSRLSAELPVLRLENDVRMAAVAEYAQIAGEGIQDLIYITGEMGAGAGIIANGQLVRGHLGQSGEIGHMVRGTSNRQCRCGRTGCWELTIGLGAFLELAADDDDPVRDPGRDVEERLGELRKRATAGDERTINALTQTADSLADGIAMLCDVLDPGQIVLGGYFAFFDDQFVAPVQRRLDSRAMVSALPRRRVVRSAFGFGSTLRGAVAHALEAVYQDPTIVRFPDRPRDRPL